MIKKIAPSSKSILQREIIASVISKHRNEIEINYLCDDTISCINSLKNICPQIEILEDKIIIEPKELILKSSKINFGESGFALRAFTPLLASFGEVEISGESTLLGRDMSSLISVLYSLGLKANAQSNKLPITISGEIKNFEIEIDFIDTSQTISGLIFLYAYLNKPAKISIKQEVKSKGYIDLTIESLAKRNFNITNNAYKEIIIEPSEAVGINTICEGCFSSASYWIIYSAIKGGVSLSNLNALSKQPDNNICDIILKGGSELLIRDGNMNFTKGKAKAFKYNAEDTPDLIPNLCVYAAFCDGVSEISGAGRLLNKESNRAEALLSEFPKMGINIIKEADSFIISGSNICSAELNSYNDHRLAIAFLLAEKLSGEKMEINHTECIKKSSPMEFYL